MYTQILRWSCSKCNTDISGNGNDKSLNTMIKNHKCNE